MTIDHRSGDRMDNRIENLRLATHTDNVRNRRLSVNNKSGTHGVRLCAKSGKWIAKISDNGRWRYLGRFASKDDAVEARRVAEVETYGEFSPIFRT